MKTEIHPDYQECSVTCSCGNTFVTHATVPELRVELCAACHPFYTGKQKLVDTGGRVERFTRRYAKSQEATPEVTTAPAPEKRKKRAEAPKKKPPVAIKGGPRPKYEPVRDESRDRQGGGGGRGGGRGGRDGGRGRGRSDAPPASGAPGDKAPAEAAPAEPPEAPTPSE